MAEQLETTYSCPCGDVEVRLSGPPMAAVFCHCQQCRDLLGGAVLEGLPYKKDNVTVTKGEDKIRDFARPDGLKFTSRCCSSCGHRVYHLNKGGAVIVTVNEVRRAHGGKVPDAFKPTAHIYYNERVLDAGDSLPKFASLPENFGGDGKLLNNNGTPVE